MMLQKIKHYFQETLWNFPLDEVNGLKRFWIKWLRIIYLSLRSSNRNQCTISASSLTYFTLMSLVPILALVIAMARVFGYPTHLQAELLEHFPDQIQIVQQIFQYADAFLEKASGGVIEGIGFGGLFITVLFLLRNLEAIFNQIWHVQKPRSWKRAVTDYFALLLIVPISFVVINSTTIFIVKFLEKGIQILPIASWITSWLLFLVHLIPYSLFGLFFTFLYFFMPNTKVRFFSAVTGAFVIAFFYLVSQWIYLFFQIGVTQYGAVYGTMATLPLFLIWVQISWFLVLLGAEIAYAHQAFVEYEFELPILRMSHASCRLMSLWIAHLALRKEEISASFLKQHFSVPVPLAKMVLQELVQCHILEEKKGVCVPSESAGEMRISDVLKRIETRGENELPFVAPEALRPFQKTLDSFLLAIEKEPNNKRLIHVSDPL